MRNQLKSISIEEIEKELSRLKYRQRYRKVMFNTIFVLVVVSAIAVLLSTLFFPVLRIYGNSMTPTYEDNDLVVCFTNKTYEKEDVVAFYYNNDLLVKRIIAEEGQWVELDKDGNLYIDDVLVEEEYIVDKALGECDIEMPYQVPSGSYFVMGDHRSTSLDSRLEVIGCVESEQIVGEILFVIWPFNM